MTTDTYLNQWARTKLDLTLREPITPQQFDALHADIVETFTVEPDLSWPEYAARIENQTAGVWARYADTLVVS